MEDLLQSHEFIQCQTPLMRLCETGAGDVPIRMVIGHGANVNQQARNRCISAHQHNVMQDLEGRTALFFAANSDCVHAAKALLDSGADICAIDMS